MHIFLSFFCLFGHHSNNDRKSLVVSFSQRISPLWIRYKLGAIKWIASRFGFLVHMTADLRIDYVQRVEKIFKIHKSTRKIYKIYKIYKILKFIKGWKITSWCQNRGRGWWETKLERRASRFNLNFNKTTIFTHFFKIKLQYSHII